MTLGEKIKKFRVEKGYTQKEVADLSNVTFQTVSKWENDENEPDVATLRKLATLFGCSLDDLLSEEENVITKNNEVQTKTIVIQKEMHVCAKCGKDIPEDDLVSEDVFKRERHGRITRSVNVGQTYYHKDCLEQVKHERVEAQRQAKKLRAGKAKRISFGWGIAGGVVAFTIALIAFLAARESVHPALGVFLSILIGYGLFAMLYCILSGSYISDVFCWCAGLSVRFPGIIFSWDLGGFAFLIVMKLLFAALGFLIGVFALIFATVLSSILGFISFPFVLVHNIKTQYGDSIITL